MGFGGVPGWMRDVIYISDFSRNILQPYFPGDTNWHFVRNPVRAIHQERADAASSTTFLFVGRLSPEKQPMQLLAMLRLLPPAYQLHVVGDGELIHDLSSCTGA